MRVHSLRFRMMLLFCAVVGVLMAVSYLGLYALLDREIRGQLDNGLLDAARPVVSDLMSDPSEDDINQLNLPDQYFELLNASGQVLQRSRNLERPLDLGALRWDVSRTVLGTLQDGSRGRLRVALIPFRRGAEQVVLTLAVPTGDTDRALATFRRILMLLLPMSLVLTAVISAWYVGRSLKPISDLTRHAAEMTEHVSDPQRRDLWTPLAVPNPHDELGRLATTFNQLFARVDSALRQLRQFVSDASHELRTPLSVLQGETELLLSQERSRQEYRETLRVIDGELKKLIRIVKGLFTLSMADAGQLRLSSDPLYLNELLEETCVLASPLAQQKGIAIQRDLSQDVAYVGDEAFLRELFLIFLDNAIKYSPEDTRVKVGLERTNGVVRVKFQDQGFGISPEHLPHIFERFYRGSGAVSAETRSGGLGLAIAQAIAQAQGGTIECQTAPGAGSSFTITLPFQLP